MIQLAYISVQKHVLSQSDVREILNASVTNNAQKNITGMLIFYNGTFLQVIEGKEQDILDLYTKIKLDPRHHNLTVLYKKKIAAASFSNWSMGFVDIAEICKDGDTDFVNYFKEPLWDQEKTVKLQIAKVKTLIDKFNNGAWRNYIR